MLAISEAHGWAKFVTMQNHYNLIYREEEREMNPLCRAEGGGADSVEVRWRGASWPAIARQ